ncbi:MAG TPA: PIN domain-containing protein [Pyrinomonadaceae bacterium]|nr:PIN domain-containing protein [Pyrinomonadaceae bacterium]
MKTNYVLIDYENVQPDNFEALQQEHIHVIIFAGHRQTQIPVKTVAALQPKGGNAEYVHLTGSGPNALDFLIAYYLGHRAAKDPKAFFHIISKDTGFDPLIQHLKERKLRVCRVQSIEEIPILKPADPKATPDRLALIVADLQKRGAARPRTVTTLSSTISAVFKKQLKAEEVSALVSDLKKKGLIKVEGKKVTYNLPS